MNNQIDDLSSNLSRSCLCFTLGEASVLHPKEERIVKIQFNFLPQFVKNCQICLAVSVKSNLKFSLTFKSFCQGQKFEKAKTTVSVSFA